MVRSGKSKDAELPIRPAVLEALSYPTEVRENVTTEKRLPECGVEVRVAQRGPKDSG